MAFHPILRSGSDVDSSHDERQSLICLRSVRRICITDLAGRKPQLTVHASFNYGFFRNGWTDLDERWILAAEPAFPRDNSEYTVIPWVYESQTRCDPLH
jgi:hypothetical protein